MITFAKTEQELRHDMATYHFTSPEHHEAERQLTALLAAPKAAPVTDPVAEFWTECQNWHWTTNDLVTIPAREQALAKKREAARVADISIVGKYNRVKGDDGWLEIYYAALANADGAYAEEA